MNANNETVERRLEDALAQLTATTAFQDDAWDRITRRGGRRTWVRWVWGGAILAAAAAAIAFAFVITADDENAHDVLVDQPELVAQGATAEQYASVIAAYRATVEEWIAYEDNCSDFDCFIQFPERYSALTAKLVAFNHVLVNVGNPDADIAALTQRTIGDTRTAIDAVNAYTSCAESAATTNECADLQDQAETAWRKLPAMFAAWDPYL